MTNAVAIQQDQSTQLETVAGNKLLESDAGLIPANMGQVVELAQLMAKAGPAVPKDFRGAPGLCAAVIFQALHWRANPFSLANLAYVVNDRVAFEAKAVHAAIESHGDLIDGLNCEYSGEGGERRITITGHIRGQSEPRVYVSPKKKDITPQNSPLWKTDPDQQLWYFASRAWARKWRPNVLLGIYTPDEAADFDREGNAPAGPEEQKTGAVSRLLAAKKPKDDEPAPIDVEVEKDEPSTLDADPAAQPVTDAAEEKPAEPVEDRAEPDTNPNAPFSDTAEAQAELESVIGNIGRPDDLDAYLDGWRDMVGASFKDEIAASLIKIGDKLAQTRRLEIAKAAAKTKPKK